MRSIGDGLAIVVQSSLGAFANGTLSSIVSAIGVDSCGVQAPANATSIVTVAVVPSPRLTCSGDSLSPTHIVATTHVAIEPGNGGSVTYSWSGAGLVDGGSTPNARWNLPGAKTVTVSFVSTGCSSACTAVVGPVTAGVSGETADRAWMSAPQPNPARGWVEIPFSLPTAQPLVLRVHDVAGRVIRHLEDGWQRVGEHVAHWDQRDDRGEYVSPGLYFLVASIDGATATRRLIVVR